MILAPNGRHLRVQHTYGTERRLLLLDLARGEEKLRESPGSMTAWWWSLQFSGRASTSTTEEEVLERGRGCARGRVWQPSHPLYL